MKYIILIACLGLSACANITPLAAEQTEAKVIADYNAAQKTVNALPLSAKHAEAQTVLNTVLFYIHKADDARLALNAADQAAALSSAQAALVTVATDIVAAKGN